MEAIINAHGHASIWTTSKLEAIVYYSGFDGVVSRLPGMSDHESLRGVDGHGKVIGDRFNEIETIVVEGIKT